MKNDKGAKVGVLKLKIMFSKELLNKEEEKKEDLVPAGNLLANQ